MIVDIDCPFIAQVENSSTYIRDHSELIIGSTSIILALLDNIRDGLVEPLFGD